MGRDEKKEGFFRKAATREKVRSVLLADNVIIVTRYVLFYSFFSLHKYGEETRKYTEEKKHIFTFTIKTLHTLFGFFVAKMENFTYSFASLHLLPFGFFVTAQKDLSSNVDRQGTFIC